jgi:hypothetical protein
VVLKVIRVFEERLDLRVLPVVLKEFLGLKDQQVLLVLQVVLKEKEEIRDQPVLEDYRGFQVFRAGQEFKAHKVLRDFKDI